MQEQRRFWVRHRIEENKTGKTEAERFLRQSYSPEKKERTAHKKTGWAELACLLVALLVDILFVDGTDSSSRAPD